MFRRTRKEMRRGHLEGHELDNMAGSRTWKTGPERNGVELEFCLWWAQQVKQKSAAFGA